MDFSPFLEHPRAAVLDNQVNNPIRLEKQLQLRSDANGFILLVKDWTRYAKTHNAALLGQAVTAPLAICITALCGILITSATATIYGDYLWNPFELLLTIQRKSSSPGARAGTFFAGLGFLASQMALCIVLNCMSGGMDLAALCPKYINIRRGSFILSFIAVAVCPWNYVTYVWSCPIRVPN